VNAKAQAERPKQGQWRRPLRWRLVRWQNHWAFLFPVPKPLGQMRLQTGIGALAISATFTMLDMAPSTGRGGQEKGCWVVVQARRAKWVVNLPLRGWRLVAHPQWLQREGRWWLVVPVKR